MDQLADIRRYLQLATRTQAAETGQHPYGKLPFITISREAGAGGRVMAKGLLDAFAERSEDPVFDGWSIFDRELCERVASDPTLNVSLRGLLDESSLNRVEDLVGILLGRSPQREINAKVLETVRELALVGKAIIVGRGGVFATRDLTKGIHVRLVAPFDVRVDREAQGHSTERAVIEKQIRERDRNRAQLSRRLGKRDVDDPMLYDAIWNTERVPQEVVVQSVMRWVELLSAA